jgi:hypothetical protein
MKDSVPTITIVHEIPGRIRFRLSESLNDPSQLEERVRGHAGIQKISYTELTKSMLVAFDPSHVTSKEMAVRLGMAYSLDKELKPIRVYSRYEREEMSTMAFLAGAFLLISLMFRIRSKAGIQPLEYGTGLITALATLEHGYQEVQERGEFDPEVLSIVYLISSFFKGNLLPASAVTWLATFGRHLIKKAGPGVEIKAERLNVNSASDPEYEMVVSAVESQSGWHRLLTMLPKVIQASMGGRSADGRGSLLGDIERMSLMHGEVIDGLGSWKHGIPVRIG